MALQCALLCLLDADDAVYFFAVACCFHVAYGDVVVDGPVIEHFLVVSVELWIGELNGAVGGYLDEDAVHGSVHYLSCNGEHVLVAACRVAWCGDGCRLDDCGVDSVAMLCLLLAAGECSSGSNGDDDYREYWKKNSSHCFNRCFVATKLQHSVEIGK